jgi:DNA-binding LacI/PurR family transcriptional regulator
MARKQLGKTVHQTDMDNIPFQNSNTHMIGVIIPGIVHHFFSSVISGIDEAAMAAGYNVMFFQSSESYDRELMNIRSALNYKVDGVLISIAKGTKKFDHIRQLLYNNIPVVFFDRACDEIETDKVIVDDFKGAFNAVDYLIRTGCRRIAHYAGPQHLQIAYLRKKGYVAALEKNGLRVDEDLIVPCDTFEAAIGVTRMLMGRTRPPDAFFTVNDTTAAGTLNTIKALGFRVPDEISIIGFTDSLVSSVTDPLLTSVGQHGFEIGRKATEILIKRINHELISSKPITEIVKTNLVIRNSTRKLSKF